MRTVGGPYLTLTHRLGPCRPNCSVECAFLVATGAASWHEYLMVFYALTLVGNILGGVALVAVLNYGQIAPEIGHS